MVRSRAVWALLLVTVVAGAMIVLREESREMSAASRGSNSSASPASSPGSRPEATASGGPSIPHPSRLAISHGPLELRIDRTRRVADGVYLHEVIQPAGPNQLRVLEVDPSTPATLELAGAGRSYPHLAATSRIAEHGDALAGVNGEFFTVPGRPEFLFQSDGTLWQTALHDSNMFAISEDEQRIYVRRISPSISASGGGSTLRVSNWNTLDPSGGEVSGYTPIGGSVAVPPSHTCYLKLGHESGPSWSAGRTATTRSYLVSRSGCGARAPSLRGGIDVVLAANAGSSGARDLARFRSGDRVRMEWSVGLPNVLDIAGGQPVLVKDGRGLVPRQCDTSFCAPQPRTAVGYTRDGRVLIATVDGRQTGWSVGMSLREWAQAFVQMGAEGVLNLDGGGSTTMWVRGEGVVNRPSNAGHRQRRVGTALLVLPGEDTDVPTSLR
jgi:Phosphodiester glycosidase